MTFIDWYVRKEKLTFIDWYVRKEKITFIDWHKLYIIHNAKKVEKKS